MKKQLFLFAALLVSMLGFSQQQDIRGKNVIADTSVKTNVIKSNHPYGGSDYEFLVIPDIQNMVRYNFQYGRPIFNWIRDSSTYYNVKGVFQVGDLTDWNTQAEWDTVTAWFNKIPASIPVQVAPGNHDYGNGFNPAGRDATRYKATMNAFNAGKTYVKGNYLGSPENYWTAFQVGSKKYLAMGLEFIPRDGVITWASNILDSVYAADPLREAIIVTHAYITVPGELSTDTSVYSGITYGMSADNSGQELWDKLIKKKPNIKWVFSGHFLIPDTWAQRGLTDKIVAVGENGNVINQIFIDYQDDVNWGDGYFMRLRFNPANNIVGVRIYSAYYNADDPRFTKYSFSDPTLAIKTTTGTTGDLIVGKDLRVVGEIKNENLSKKTVPFVAEDHQLKSDQRLYYDESKKQLNANGFKVNFPRTWQSDHLYQNGQIEAFDSAGYSLFQIKASKYDPIPFGEAYLANLYIGDSAGYNNPSGWNNLGIGPKSMYRAKWGGNGVSETVSMGKRSAYGIGKRASSYNNVIIGVEALSGDSTYCRFCTIVGQAAASQFPGGEDNTLIGQASGVSMKLGSFGSSAIGSNTFQVAYAYESMAIGKGSFGNSDTVLYSNAFGRSAFRDVTAIRSIAIGYYAAYNVGRTVDRLYIDNNGLDGVPALVYGEFDNQLLRVNGTLNVTNKLTVDVGANKSIGTATLAAGTVTVSTTLVTSSSKIFVTVNTPGGTQGFLSVPTASIVNGTSFVINSTSNTETSTVNWWIVN